MFPLPPFPSNSIFCFFKQREVGRVTMFHCNSMWGVSIVQERSYEARTILLILLFFIRSLVHSGVTERGIRRPLAKWVACTKDVPSEFAGINEVLAPSPSRSPFSSESSVPHRVHSNRDSYQRAESFINFCWSIKWCMCVVPTNSLSASFLMWSFPAWPATLFTQRFSHVVTFH